MGENGITVIEISPSSCEKEKKVFHLVSEETESPIRHIICLKSAEDVKHFEETEECFILDFDPFETPDLSKLSVSFTSAADDEDAPDVAVVAEKGQVACRDYPHSRHLCLKFPFEATSHESYCEQCFCYVCDSPAPCSTWTEPKPAHCHASEQSGNWKHIRFLKQQQKVVYH